MSTTPDKQTVREDPVTFAELALNRECFPYQEDFLRADSSRKALVCGRQVGKTEVCATDGLHYASTNRDVTVLILAPTQRQSSELFKRVKDLIGESGKQWGVERSTQTIIELENQSRIICLPAGSDGHNIRGYTADYIIVDEAAFVPDDIFTSVLLPMLATTNGTLALASTPFGKSGFLYEQAWTGDDWHITHAASEDSPLVTSEFIQDQEQTLSKLEYRQEILGEFVESANAFFPRELITGATDDTATFRANDTVVIGADIARHGADRTVIVPIDSAGVISKTHMVSDPDLDLTDATGHIARLYRDLDVAKVVVDETGVGAGPVEMLQNDLGERAVEGFKFTIDDKQSIYNQLKSDLENGAVTLPAHQRLQREFKDLEYELTRGGKTKIHHPGGGHDDHPDAVALAAYGRRHTHGADSVMAFQL